MIKLIAIDLDGTLLNNNKNISERNIQTLKKAKEQGVKVVICTGRPLIAIQSFIHTLGLTDEGDYSITFNGGLVQRNDTGEIIEEIVMTLEDVDIVNEVTSNLDLPLDIVSEDIVYNVMPQPYPSIYHQLNGILSFKSVNRADLTEKDKINKMVVAVEANFLDKQIEKMSEEFKEQYNIVKSRDCLLEILHKDVTKANGIALLAKDLGISQEEVMALGDEENDLTMIEYAGLGVAMGNGSSVIKEAADYITASNEDDGVALAVEKFVLKDR